MRKNIVYIHGIWRRSVHPTFCSKEYTALGGRVALTVLFKGLVKGTVPFILKNRKLKIESRQKKNKTCGEKNRGRKLVFDRWQLGKR